MSNFEKLKKIIEKSSLSLQAKKLMIDFWKRTEDDDLAMVVALMRNEPEWIEKIYRNIELKQKAMTTKDTKLWNEILEEEKKLLLPTL